jgi:hypothetical protein
MCANSSLAYHQHTPTYYQHTTIIPPTYHRHTTNIPPTLGRRVGTILLALCLCYGVLHEKRRSVLHVAGGRKNVPALRLYVYVSQHHTAKGQHHSASYSIIQHHTAQDSITQHNILRYERFGFQEAPEGVFRQPQKNLYVLPDIFRGLSHLSPAFHLPLTCLSPASLASRSPLSLASHLPLVVTFF